MAHFAFLTSDNLDEMMALQADVIDDLNDKGFADFVIERSRDYFQTHLENPSAVLGVRSDEGELIAQSIFHHSDSLNPDYIKGLSLPDWKLCDPVTIMQGVIVHPNAQGQGLSSRMIDAWLGWAKEKDYQHGLTRVEERNEKSMQVFLKAGLDDIGSVIDARDNATVHVLYKGLSDE